MKKRILSLCMVLILCLTLLPATALAADGNTVYVGGVELTGSTDTPAYATTDDSGNVSTEGASADNYNIKWDSQTLTLKGAYVTGQVNSGNIAGAAIGVENSNGAELTIQLEDSNTVSAYIGIHVHSSGGTATLTITGNGSLNASGFSNGIQVQSNGDSAALSIEAAKVIAKSEYGYGVNVRCNTNSAASLTVDGGSLTASGSTGILYDSSSTDAVPNTVNLTISNSALVDARDSGIGSGSITNLTEVSPADGSVGIVFGHDRSDSKAGIVYGNVTLQEDLEIDEGESLTIGDGASLTVPLNTILTNNGTVTTTGSGSLTNNGTISNSGILPENVGGNGKVNNAPIYSVSVTPDKISLPSVTEGYDPQDPKTITIKNTGNQTILLKDYGNDPWLIITLDKNALKPNEEARVSIKLKDDLSAETRSTLKDFITYTSEDDSYRDYAHFEVTYEVRHDMKHVDAKEPTHLEEGNIAYWYCEYCDKYYKDGAGANELSLEDITIPKLKDQTATGTPSDNDKPSEDQTGDTTSTETGDDSNMAMWAVLMLLAAAGATGATLYGRRKRVK